jgi:hypothetical protein
MKRSLRGAHQVLSVFVVIIVVIVIGIEERLRSRVWTLLAGLRVRDGRGYVAHFALRYDACSWSVRAALP